MLAQIYTILKERVGGKFKLRLLFRGSKHGFKDSKFHEFCDKKGPLLVLVQTSKDILVGGFSSIAWKSVGGYVKDPKCVVFSLTRNKVYLRKNEFDNLFFA
jgi:hypothetical protein